MNSIGKVLKLIEESDLIIEVLDSRFAEETRNRELEKNVLEKRKKLLLVINKSDLVSKNFLDKKKKELSKEFQTIFYSAKTKQGKNLLKKVIGKILGNGTIGIIGYPNTGKSALINSLAGRRSAKVASIPHYTKGVQKIRLWEKTYLMDSPGIIPKKEQTETGLVLIGAKHIDNCSNIEIIGEEIIEFIFKNNPSALEPYGIKSNAKKGLEEIAQRFNMKASQNKLDLEKAAKKIAIDWQNGKIKL